MIHLPMGWQGINNLPPHHSYIVKTVRGTLRGKRECNMTRWFKDLWHGIKMRRKGYVLMQGEDGSWWWVGYD